MLRVTHLTRPLIFADLGDALLSGRARYAMGRKGSHLDRVSKRKSSFSSLAIFFLFGSHYSRFFAVFAQSHTRQTKSGTESCQAIRRTTRKGFMVSSMSNPHIYVSPCALITYGK